jgi:leucyl aminopeptidase
LAVGGGSPLTPPRLIAIEYQPVKGKSRKPVAQSKPYLVVGKSITFDTGGISIKPAANMQHMIFDKCGGMAVLGLMYALAKLKPDVPVVGLLSSAENHVSDTAYRPGDVLRMYNGVTVEITNTDAEGRLVLADALSWGIETYKPRAVVNLATLTGGVIVALGRTITGLMSRDDAICHELTAAGDRAGERLWRLPLGEEASELLKSTYADISNSGGRDGHVLQGGAFLANFVPPTVPWAHLDIAGTASTEKDLPLYGKGATGWGIRTLLEWVSPTSAD